ncbi:hypothetical protein D3C80_2001520 [compost metagenome]
MNIPCSRNNGIYIAALGVHGFDRCAVGHINPNIATRPTGLNDLMAGTQFLASGLPYIAFSADDNNSHGLFPISSYRLSL